MQYDRKEQECHVWFVTSMIFLLFMICVPAKAGSHLFFESFLLGRTVFFLLIHYLDDTLFPHDAGRDECYRKHEQDDESDHSEQGIAACDAHK